MVRPHFKDMDKECFTILYKSFVTPHLEYVIQAWSPYLQRDIDCLEKILRRATKLVKGMKNLSYGQGLCNLGLPALTARRLRGDLIETYKIVTEKENIKIEDFFEFGVTGYSLRGHRYKIATKQSRLEVQQNFFSQRAVGRWNQLPSHIVEAPSLNAFKNRYDSWKSGAS